MLSKIMYELSDCLKGKLSKDDMFELSLMMVAWGKLSVTKEIPEDLRITRNAHISFSDMKKIFNQLGEEYGAFKEDYLLDQIDTVQASKAVDLINNVILTGVIDAIQSVDFQEFTSYMRESIWEMPTELAELMNQLAGPLNGTNVYIPWDSTGILSCNAAKEGAMVFSENPRPKLSILHKIISSQTYEIRAAEPIKSPSYVHEGKLKKFDVSLSLPPFGIRYEDDVIRKDWYGRFKSTARSGDVLLIKHLLAVTQGRIVITVANNILFSVGSERQFREELIEAGYLEAVINLPSGIFEYTNISTCVLVLNAGGSSKNIKFIDVDSELFKERVSRSKYKLKNINLIVDAFNSDADNDYSRSISTNEVRANNYQLQATRYVLQKEALKAQEYLNRANLVKLRQIVETVRPVVGRAQEGGIEVYEVSGVDFPEYGEINSPGKSIMLDEKLVLESHHQFLKPNDIVLMIKGNVGKVGIVGTNVPNPGEGGWIAGQSALVLRMRSGSSEDAKGLYMQLRSPLGQAILSKVTSGATIQLIQQRELLELEVIAPNDESIKNAARLLDEENKYQIEIDRLKNLQKNVSENLWQL